MYSCMSMNTPGSFKNKLLNFSKPSSLDVPIVKGSIYKKTVVQFIWHKINNI